MPFAILDFSTFIEHLSEQAFHYHARGHNNAASEPGLPHAVFQLRALAANYSWPLLAFALVGVVAGFRADWRTTTYVLVAPVVLFLYFITAKANFSRNLLLVYAVVPIFAAAGVMGLIDAAVRWSSRHRALSRFSRAATVALSAAAVLYAIALAWPGMDRTEAPPARRLADWLEVTARPFLMSASVSDGLAPSDRDRLDNLPTPMTRASIRETVKSAARGTLVVMHAWGDVKLNRWLKPKASFGHYTVFERK
jgi:hypothetical protein